MTRTPSTGYIQRFGSNDVTSGEYYTALTPTGWQGDGTVPGVVVVHGYGDSSAIGWSDSDHAGSVRIGRSLARAGYPVVAADLGGQATWGNTPIVSRIDDAITYLQTKMGAKTGKVVLVGVSMGGLNSLVYTYTKPANVACVVLIAAVSDVTWTVNNTTLNTSINATYAGGWSEATYGASHNPMTIAANGGYAGMPILYWQGVDDQTAPLSNAQSFASKVSTCTLNKIPGGHSENTWGEVDWGISAAFIAANT